MLMVWLLFVILNEVKDLKVYTAVEGLTCWEIFRYAQDDMIHYKWLFTSVTILPSNKQMVRLAYEASCCEWVTIMMVVPS